MMNDKMTVLPSPHAIQRAKERYNLDLTQEDIEYICKFCLAGNAGPPLLTKNIFGELKITLCIPVGFTVWSTKDRL